MKHAVSVSFGAVAEIDHLFQEGIGPHCLTRNR